MADTFHGEPMDITMALGDQVQVIRLGRAIGLGAIRAAVDDAGDGHADTRRGPARSLASWSGFLPS